MDWYPREAQIYRDKTWDLSLAEHGAYTLLIDYYYTSESPLPNNDKALASIIGCDLDEWLAVKVNVTRYFSVSNGLLTHEKCDDVLETQLLKRKDGKARVAKYRAKRDKSDVTRDKHVSNAPKGKERKGKDKKNKEDSDNKNELLNECCSDFWLKYPKPVGKEPAMKALTETLNDTPFETIMAGLKVANAKWSEDGTETKFIPNATTWIKEKRWLDEDGAAPPIEETNARRAESVKKARDAQMRMKISGAMRVIDKYGGELQPMLDQIAKDLGVDIADVNAMAKEIQGEKNS